MSLLLVACGGGDDSGDKLATKASGDTQSEPAKPLVKGLPDFSQLVRQVSPAVVNISALPPDEPRAGTDESGDRGGETPGDNGALGDWLKRFFGDEPDEAPSRPGPGGSEHVSLGSGFVVSPDGYILTNRHVIAGAGQIVVKLNDRRQLLAKVVGADPDSDIAVLKVDAKDLPTVSIGDPSKLDVGAWVVAIGSPFGFETSVTAGIVSAKDRNLADNQYVPFLQTDVAINPGNSGGPLFNLSGQVVGINSQIFSQTGGYQGVSFAIPIDVAMNAAKQLKNNGEVVRGWLGVQIQNVDRKLARSFDLSRPVGALVTQIMKNSPAAASGLQVGDVILSFNGHAVDSAADLPPLVGVVAPGDKAELDVLRQGKHKNVPVTIKALPSRFRASGEAPDGSPGARPGDRQPFGLTLAPLRDDERKRLGIEAHGVIVGGVTGGPARAAGLQAGDVILSAGDRAVDKPADVIQALRRAEGPVALLVVREGNRRYLTITPDAPDNDEKQPKN
ncbi:Do family serine endopeptidase [Salinisphaera sp. Q1T1-3]|nr:Do family serine endopeptidase [Salinisphaera sp. Q1T1-3]